MYIKKDALTPILRIHYLITLWLTGLIARRCTSFTCKTHNTDLSIGGQLHFAFIPLGRTFISYTNV